MHEAADMGAAAATGALAERQVTAAGAAGRAIDSSAALVSDEMARPQAAEAATTGSSNVPPHMVDDIWARRQVGTRVEALTLPTTAASVCPSRNPC